MNEKLGRFGHHPDPAIDFCVEVEELQGMAYNRKVNFDPEPSLNARVDKAMLFRVGGDLGAISAKALLREIDATLDPAKSSSGDKGNSSMTTEAKLLADRLRYLSQHSIGLKESLEIVDKLPRIVELLDLVAYPKHGSKA